jgi:hypothetical protein
MVPLPTWPNPNEYDGSLLKSNPYLTAKEGTRKKRLGTVRRLMRVKDFDRRGY